MNKNVNNQKKFALLFFITVFAIYFFSTIFSLVKFVPLIWLSDISFEVAICSFYLAGAFFGFLRDPIKNQIIAAELSNWLSSALMIYGMGMLSIIILQLLQIRTPLPVGRILTFLFYPIVIIWTIKLIKEKISNPFIWVELLVVKGFSLLLQGYLWSSSLPIITSGFTYPLDIVLIAGRSFLIASLYAVIRLQAQNISIYAKLILVGLFIHIITEVGIETLSILEWFTRMLPIVSGGIFALVNLYTFIDSQQTP